MIKRDIAKHLKRLVKSYPVVTITGPRQSGKTFLVRETFPKKPYANLENLDTRKTAVEDPRGFLKRFPEGAIIDEAYRAPDLFSYIQTTVDDAKKEGMFVLTGSAQFELLHNLSQSLAGRSAILRLLPFSCGEIRDKYYKNGLLTDELLYKGFYPRIYDKNLNPTEALSFYTNTYLERDVRTFLGVKDLSKFETFLRLCATRVGQIVNLSSLGNDCGINHNTAESWLSILEASYIIFRIRPHHTNLSKRLIKSPKLYFYDVGLASYLLGIKNVSHVKTHPLRGSLFENLVIAELMKMRFNDVKDNNLYYFRDNVGNEVDLVLDFGDKVLPVEIKAGETFNTSMLKGLEYYKKLNKNLYSKPLLIYGGDEVFDHKDFRVTSLKHLSEMQKAFL